MHASSLLWQCQPRDCYLALCLLRAPPILFPRNSVPPLLFILHCHSWHPHRYPRTPWLYVYFSAMSVHDTAEGEASSGLLQQSLTRPTDTTCDVCQHLHFEHDEGKLQGFTFDSAYQSAQSGCAGCAVIARFLKDFRGHGDGMDGLTKNWNLCKKGESTYLRVFVHVAALAYRRAEYLELSTTSGTS